MEYKFRAKRVDNGQWIYGSLVFVRDVDNNPSIIQAGDNRFISVHRDTIGQFTNRLDNDLLSDIYQGDILQSVNGKMWEVIFKNYSWTISNERIKDSGKNKFGGIEEYTFWKYIQICKKSKVEPFKKIGNIHDHSHLIENQ